VSFGVGLMYNHPEQGGSSVGKIVRPGRYVIS
jgi:hypothetical protein